MTTKPKTRKVPAANTTTPKAARKKGVLSIIRDFLAIGRKPKRRAMIRIGGLRRLFVAPISERQFPISGISGRGRPQTGSNYDETGSICHARTL